MISLDGVLKVSKQELSVIMALSDERGVLLDRGRNLLFSENGDIRLNVKFEGPTLVAEPYCFIEQACLRNIRLATKSAGDKEVVFDFARKIVAVNQMVKVGKSKMPQLLVNIELELSRADSGSSSAFQLRSDGADWNYGRKKGWKGKEELSVEIPFFTTDFSYFEPIAMMASCANGKSSSIALSFPAPPGTYDSRIVGTSIHYDDASSWRVSFPFEYLGFDRNRTILVDSRLNGNADFDQVESYFRQVSRLKPKPKSKPEAKEKPTQAIPAPVEKAHVAGSPRLVPADFLSEEELNLVIQLRLQGHSALAEQIVQAAMAERAPAKTKVAEDFLSAEELAVVNQLRAQGNLELAEQIVQAAMAERGSK